jgi:WD40 repeat protein
MFDGSNQSKILLQVLRAHRDEVWFIQFSNNGKYLASASNDKSAMIWEVNLGIYSSNVFYSHDLCRNSVAYSLVSYFTPHTKN